MFSADYVPVYLYYVMKQVANHAVPLFCNFHPMFLDAIISHKIIMNMPGCRKYIVTPSMNLMRPASFMSSSFSVVLFAHAFPDVDGLIDAAWGDHDSMNIICGVDLRIDGGSSSGRDTGCKHRERRP